MTTPAGVQRIYLTLLLGNTLAASLIWGINTIFLLDAGLSNLEAFAANAAYTAGMVVFEVPTGIVADTIGRRVSYLLGTLTLAATTLLYVLLWRIEAPFWLWAIVSVGLGLGFTFFSGAVEAWLVDALDATGYRGSLETVFGRGQAVTGGAMLAGSVAGGYLAQATNLGVPFVVRGAILVVMFALAYVVMKDVGFTPGARDGLRRGMRRIWGASLGYGWNVPEVKWVMVASAFTAGVGIYAFYALQPYLLELWGDEEAYGIAGLAAAIVAGAQLIGGLAAPWIRRAFARRTSALLLVYAASSASLLLIGLLQQFVVAIVLISLWGLMTAAATPIRQAYLNGLIPSQQRATILSFDSMLGSAGGVVVQPALGRSADVWGYPGSYLVGAGVSALALPFVWLSRRQDAPADQAVGEVAPVEAAP